MTSTILLVEDDAAIALVISETLAELGHRVEAVASLGERDRWLANQRADVMITDVILPDGDALNALPSAAAHSGPVIVLSAQNSLDTAVRAAAEGSFDYLPKPFDLDELVDCVTAAIATAAAPPLDPAKLPAIPNPAINHGLVGRSAAMQKVYRTIARLSSNDLAVLIFGESGTGKEVAARAIHHTGKRRGGPFVAVNMAAIPRDLIEAELFGHEKGAFTGAHMRGIGRFEQAAGGTLFLDEIGDMPMEAQTRLLRVLQSGEYGRVGGQAVLRADVRILAATHRDLAALVAAGGFREDLYFRLNVIPLHLPPLRTRADDIPALAESFMAQGRADGLAAKQFTPAAMARLARHGWPGNVRELGNVVQRLAVMVRGAVVADDDVAAVLRGTAGASDAAPASREMLDAAIAAELAQLLADNPQRGDLHARISAAVDRVMIGRVLDANGGNQLASARQLGINRNTLRKRLAELALVPPRG